MDLHLRFDIALLRLSTEATLNSHVQLGSLPPSGQILPNNNLCYITGWGRTSSELINSKVFSVKPSVSCLYNFILSSWWQPVFRAEAGLPSCGRPQDLH